jgi:putative hemolysin
MAMITTCCRTSERLVNCRGSTIIDKGELKRTKIRGCLRVPVWEIERHEKELERERRCNPFHLQQRAAAPFNSQAIEPGQVRDIVLGRETFF